MNVGFFHVGVGTVHRTLAATLVASVRHAMPDVPITHFTNLDTPGFSYVDYTVRRPVTSLALGCLEAYAAAGPGDWLFVDTDVVVQRDVRGVFDDAFDVAVADRAGTLLEKEVGTKFMSQNPYNKGAVFSRMAEFWLAASAVCRTFSDARQEWMGDQVALNELILSGRYQVRVLPNDYNYPPRWREDDVHAKAIVHYKGPRRKAWMLERAS